MTYAKKLSRLLRERGVLRTCNATVQLWLCVGERSDGLLVAWRFYDCVLSCSCTLWLSPFTLS